MGTTLCIFEDHNCVNLQPLTYFRPSYGLRCGMLTLQQKIERYAGTGTTIYLHCRAYLAPLLRLQQPGNPVNTLPRTETVLVNGACIAAPDVMKALLGAPTNTLIASGGVVIGGRLSPDMLKQLPITQGEPLNLSVLGLPVTEIPARIAAYPFSLVNANGAELIADFALLTAGLHAAERLRGKVYAGAHLVNEERIYIAEGAVIKPGAVLDAEDGPIYIGGKAVIYPNAVIIGPAFVGAESRIKTGAKIYENTSIGEVCKVGGEVEDAIIHSYSNKQHDGFLGHAYLGMWVNLGADTNNSDLKNNYGTIKVIINGKPVDSGSMFVGLTMGDHSKAGINTMFNTGTVVGVSSNVFGAEFPPKYVPSFCWGIGAGAAEYRVEKAIEVARRVMGRRKIALSAEEEAVFRHVFAITQSERVQLSSTEIKE